MPGSRSRFSSQAFVNPHQVTPDVGLHRIRRESSMQAANSDTQAIYQAVSDYYDGWYEPNMERMDRSLHADLAKRAIKLDEAGKEYLLHLTKEVMVDATEKGGGSNSPAEKKNWTIRILDCYEEIATVKVNCPEYVEYIHLARQDRQWQIVNVLWTDCRGNL
jgi:hypothetical protein